MLLMENVDIKGMLVSQRGLHINALIIIVDISNKFKEKPCVDHLSFSEHGIYLQNTIRVQSSPPYSIFSGLHVYLKNVAPVKSLIEKQILISSTCVTANSQVLTMVVVV